MYLLNIINCCRLVFIIKDYVLWIVTTTTILVDHSKGAILSHSFANFSRNFANYNSKVAIDAYKNDFNNKPAFNRNMFRSWRHLFSKKANPLRPIHQNFVALASVLECGVLYAPKDKNTGVKSAMSWRNRAPIADGWIKHTVLNINYGVNRLFHVLKTPVYRFDLYGR